MRFLSRRLQTKLLAWTALILVISIAITFEIRTQLNLQLLTSNLNVRAETIVTAVTNTIPLGDGEFDAEAVTRRLREFVQADPTLDRLDIVDRSGPTVHILASSDDTPSPLITEVPVTLTTTERNNGGRRDMVTVLPVDGTRYTVVALVSFENLQRYEDLNRLRDPIFGIVLIAIVVTLMNFMYRRTVSRRFDELMRDIRAAQAGNLTAIPDTNDDEIGTIARTMNGLLTQIRSFNDELRREVANATDNLNLRNAELEEITRQVVAMQRQLLQAERLATVGQMAATFAHEIGSPMSSLSVHVQLLLEDPRLTSEQRETLTLVREQIQAMIQIVNDLLRSARRGPADFVPTDVNEILQTVVRLVHPKLKSQRIDVRTDYARLPKVRAYPVYLQEAFLNLINNASDAMPEGGRLEVRSRFEETSDRVNVWITDTGPGIDPSVLSQVFDRFVTTKSLGDGTGLGLGIVKEILDGHRGTIEIIPAVGRGTCAYITLPADKGVVGRADRAVVTASERRS